MGIKNSRRTLAFRQIADPSMHSTFKEMEFCQDLAVETLEFSEKGIDQGEGGWIFRLSSWMGYSCWKPIRGDLIFLFIRQGACTQLNMIRERGKSKIASWG